MAWSLTHADDASGGDDTDIDGRTLPTGGSTWVKNSTGGGRIDIVSGEFKNGVDGGVLVYVSGVDVGDQKSEFKRLSSGNPGPIVRYNASNGYHYLSDPAGNTIYRRDGGYTSIGTISSWGSSGDTVSMEIEGTAIVMRVNGSSVGTATDSNFASGSYGVGMAALNATYDDWAGYQVAAATGQPTARRFGAVQYSAFRPLGIEGVQVN